MRSFLVLSGVIALAGASPVSPSAKKGTTATTRTGTTTTTVYAVDPTADIDPACVVDPLDCLTSPQALGTPTRVVHAVKAPSAVTPSSAGVTDIVDSATRKWSYVTSDIGDDLPITLGFPRHALEKSSALTASVAGPADIRVSITGKAVSATSDVGEDLPLTIILPRHAIEDGSAVINRNPTSASLTNRNGTLSASGTPTTHPTVYIVPTTTSGVDQPPLDVVLCELDCYWDCVDTVGPEDEDSQLMCVYQCIDYCEGQHSSVTATAKMPSPTARHRALPAPSALKRNITIPAWTKGVIRTTGSSRRHAPSSTPEVPSVVDDMHHCLEACVHGCNTVPGPQNACKVQCSRKCTAAIPNFPPVFANKALRPHQVDRRSLPTVTSAAHTADKNTSAEVSPDDYSRTLSKFQDVLNITSEFWDKYEDEQPDFNDDLFDVDVDDLKSIWDKLTASPAAHTIDRNATRALPIAPVATIKSMQSRLREDANKLFDLQWDFYNVMDDLRYARENISSDLSSLASAWHELAGPTLARRGVSMPEVTGTQTGDWHIGCDKDDSSKCSYYQGALHRRSVGNELPKRTSNVAPISQISDGQIQAPLATSIVPITQISDGQIQAPHATSTSVSSVHSSLASPTITYENVVPITQISDGQVEAPHTTSASAADATNLPACVCTSTTTDHVLTTHTLSVHKSASSAETCGCQKPTVTTIRDLAISTQTVLIPEPTTLTVFEHKTITKLDVHTMTVLQPAPFPSNHTLIKTVTVPFNITTAKRVQTSYNTTTTTILRSDPKPTPPFQPATVTKYLTVTSPGPSYTKSPTLPTPGTSLNTLEKQFRSASCYDCKDPDQYLCDLCVFSYDTCSKNIVCIEDFPVGITTVCLEDYSACYDD